MTLTTDQKIANAIAAHVAKLHAPPPPPATGIPPMPFGKWTKTFADGTLAPFVVRTYPDLHPTDNMERYNRYANGAKQVTVHDGYADLRATKRTDGLWDAVLLSTAMDGIGYEMTWGKLSFCVRLNVGRATWQGTWLGDTRWTSATEYDWIEMLELQQMSAHAIGAVTGSLYAPPPADLATTWHIFTIDRQPGYVAFLLDGVERKRITATMPTQPLSVMLNAQIGFPWAEGPDATTPNPAWLQVAWVVVE